MPGNFAGLSQSRLDLARWKTTKNFKMAEFREKSKLYKQPLHSRSYLFNFNLILFE